MQVPFEVAALEKIPSQVQAYFFSQVLSWTMLMQLAVVGCAFL